MDRRAAVKTGVLASCVGSNLIAQDTSAGPPSITPQLAKSFSKPVFIATWPFGQSACEKSRDVLATGGSLRDAVERGINVVELDPSISSVGYGGRPNADGVVQLDASFMDGTRQKAGAVAALEGYPNAISVARRVMEKTRHVMLAGADAAKFASQNGFKSRDMLTDDSREAWLDWKEKNDQGISKSDNHDTISLLGLADDGHLVGGCSTSGLAFKLPGRVGDSPLIGAGLYVDGQVGAAGATGVGENILRYCGSFLIVEFMRQGMEPTQACEATIRRIATGEQRPPSELSVNFVAINARGRVGAAGTDDGFRCAVVDSDQSVLLRPSLVK